ncbi:hypothetical protein [uncultured Ruegeria sp.]|uniref:hypothetical protein n=1 Tax=uncultured Ruegeria sp. TaxID=259304 RepID=UPI0026088757|nr:hypothetical protein [uncultured Ruegeria sp.]
MRGLIIGIACVSALGIATLAGLITGNVSPSAPTGLYVRADPVTADYVTFCLAEQHSEQPFYHRFCSPIAPDKIRILKRITVRRPDGALIVKGIAAGSIDSELIGPVQPSQIHAYWRHVHL